MLQSWWKPPASPAKRAGSRAKQAGGRKQSDSGGDDLSRGFWGRKPWDRKPSQPALSSAQVARFRKRVVEAIAPTDEVRQELITTLGLAQRIRSDGLTQVGSAYRRLTFVF